MPLDPQKILNWQFPDIEHTYSEKDTMLYALGLGCGSDPGEPGDLKYVYERGLVALPTSTSFFDACNAPGRSSPAGEPLRWRGPTPSRCPRKVVQAPGSSLSDRTARSTAIAGVDQSMRASATVTLPA